MNVSYLGKLNAGRNLFTFMLFTFTLFTFSLTFSNFFIFDDLENDVEKQVHVHPASLGLKKT